ncbi:unnamed protein product [Clonostachys rosea]|uniref:PCI domain-containing protein n=1 Tax=Bionectria ochroleuca TaxID=29856 RepID=A0ABY6UX37_BIOOC|nr:unnamed protein product [Clonostachys rosea]
MEQTKALNALEPFLALSKSANSPRAAADLITRATSAPNTFIFAELLQTPQITALSKSPEFLPYYKLLQIFSHGTYQAYKTTPDLPALSDPQTLKLRQLSLLSLVRDRNKLSYDSLQKNLDLETTREVEDLVITAIYAGLVNATLDPARQAVQVSSIAPVRDLAPGAIPEMTAILHTWSGRCSSTLTELNEQISNIRASAALREKEKKAAEEKLKSLITDAKENDSSRSDHHRDQLRRTFNKRTIAGGSGRGDDMELDEPFENEPKGRSSKRKI